MFSLGIQQLLDDLSSNHGPERLLLAYLDDIYILRNNPIALEDVQAFSASRQTSIRLILRRARPCPSRKRGEYGMKLLGSCIV
jgi:hypothetical protein